MDGAGKLWGQVDKTEPWTTKSEPEEKNACQKAADEWSYLVTLPHSGN